MEWAAETLFIACMSDVDSRGAENFDNDTWLETTQSRTFVRPDGHLSHPDRMGSIPEVRGPRRS